MQFPSFRTSFRDASLLVLSIAALSSGAHAAPKEVGVWIDNSGDGAVKIEPCGDRLCGRIVWLRNPLNDQGVPKHDRYNPDEGQRNRPICGLPVLGDLSAVPEGGFDNGWVYDPKEGKSYSVAIVADGANTLNVTGYKGVKFLGKTFTWTRAKGDLPSCSVQPASAKPATDSAVAGAAGAVATPKPKKVPAAEPVAAETAVPSEPDASAPKAQPKTQGGTAAAPITDKAAGATAKDATAEHPAKSKPKAASTGAADRTEVKPAAAAKAKPQAEKSATADSAAKKTDTKKTDTKKKVVAKAAKPAKEAEGKEVLPWSTGQ